MPIPWIAPGGNSSERQGSFGDRIPYAAKDCARFDIGENISPTPRTFAVIEIADVCRRFAEGYLSAHGARTKIAEMIRNVVALFKGPLPTWRSSSG